MSEHKGRYVLFILAQSLLYGIGNPVTKIAYDGGITPLWLLSCRFFIAALTCYVLFRRRIRAQLPKANIRHWLPSALGMAGAYICCNLALGLTSATNVGFLISLPVLFTPFLTSLLLHRRYDLRVLPVQLLSVAGLFLLCCGESGLSFGLGEVLGLLDALSLAFALIFSERSLREIDGTVLTFLQASVTFVISLCMALCFDDASVLPAVEGKAWAVVLYLALGCTVLAYLLQNFAVAHLSAATVSVLQCTQPILTALISFIVLREQLTALGIFGGVLIVAALLLNSRREKRLTVPAAKNE